MSWQAQANRNDVLYQSGIFGLEPKQYAFNAPEGVKTAVTGGARTEFIDSGVEVHTGNTSGDTASVSAQQIPQYIDGFSKYIYEGVYYTGPHKMPSKGEFKIGLAENTKEKTGAYIDITNNKFVANKTEKPVTVPDNEYNQMYVRIVSSKPKNETTLTFSSVTGVQNVTISSIPRDVRKKRIVCESGGVDEQLILQFSRTTLIPEQ